MILKGLKKDFQAKQSFIVCWQVKKIIGKEYEYVFKVLLLKM